MSLQAISSEAPNAFGFRSAAVRAIRHCSKTQTRPNAERFVRPPDRDDSIHRWFELQLPAVVSFAGADLVDPLQVNDEVAVTRSR